MDDINWIRVNLNSRRKRGTANDDLKRKTGDSEIAQKEKKKFNAYTRSIPNAIDEFLVVSQPICDSSHQQRTYAHYTRCIQIYLLLL